jgi:hypothetical protein
MPDTLYPDLEQRYDVLKKKAQQQAAEQSAAEQEALKRKFSSLGMSGSGEDIKQQQLAIQRGGQNYAQAAEAIDTQRMAEVGQREYAGQVRKEEQAYQSAEAQKQREFAKQEAIDQRQFQSLEAQYGRQFAAEQSQIERNQKEKFFNVQSAFQNRQFEWQQAVSSRDYLLDLRVSEFNMKMAEQQANKKSFMERAIDPFGTLDIFGGLKTKTDNNETMFGT